MNDEKMDQFIIYVGNYLLVQTPYSAKVFHYDDLNDCLEDIKYCLECEVKNYGKKNEEV